MTAVSCSVPERFVNPLFEVFDGGDFILSSYRDVEESLTRMNIYFEDGARAEEAKRCLGAALAIVGVDAPLEVRQIPDEDWKFAYRRHFKTEPIGRRLLVVPTWELEKVEKGDLKRGREVVTLDPGLAFGTGKHETTRACLEYLDELSRAAPQSMLDMGSGSGILSIAAAKLGYSPVAGFDVDPEAVAASEENAALNGVEVVYRHFALGRPDAPAPAEAYDLVVANILGPLLIRFAPEIDGYCRDRLIVSGILTALYPEVLAAFAAVGFVEVSAKTYGEWTTGLLRRR